MNSYTSIVEYFDEDLKFVFNCIDELILNKITEIRIRRNKPIILVIKNSSYFVDYNGDLYDYPCHNSVVINAEKFDELFMKLCDYSIYSSLENMKNGFITLKNGARIGIASTCVIDKKEVVSVKDITSLNIRIPRQINGVADKVLNFLYTNSFPSIIVAGKPNSGKTTLLRDIAFQLSNGFNNEYKKVCVIDERNEICGKQNYDFSTEIGINTDVLSSFNKALGIDIATRTLSPQIIVCDEISTFEEVESIRYAFSSGIAFALSVHISNVDDIRNRDIIKALIETKQFQYIVLLKDYTYQVEIIDVSEVEFENRRNSTVNDINNWNRASNNSISKEKI